ncbi:MAG: hypothetical protein EPO26_12700 [Chloroflexota bacterium]|nr:MAG: hypothetical protein EPO26_12700 [Chloroflexota bacterium]
MSAITGNSRDVDASNAWNGASAAWPVVSRHCAHQVVAAITIAVLALTLSCEAPPPPIEPAAPIATIRAAVEPPRAVLAPGPPTPTSQSTADAPRATVATAPATPTMQPAAEQRSATLTPVRGASVPPGAAAPSPIATLVMPAGIVQLRAANGTTRDVRVEIASDDATRARGLMFRESMPEDAGMLFVFAADIDAGFWMQNTLIPLSIAFIDANGVIVGLDDMQPRTTDIHRPNRPYRFALEVNQGYFARHGIRVGDRATIPS